MHFASAGPTDYAINAPGRAKLALHDRVLALMPLTPSDLYSLSPAPEENGKVARRFLRSSAKAPRAHTDSNPT